MSLQSRQEQIDISAPMPSAPMKYLVDGSVDWGGMWTDYCVLAQDGGPPHRGTMLNAPKTPDVDSDSYRFAEAEIIRGIRAVSNLTAFPTVPGWIGVQCHSSTMASWMKEAILQENVHARTDDQYLLVPVGETFRLKYEIKNVITAVAKVAHYWEEHLAVEVKQALATQEQLGRVTSWFKKLLGVA